MSIPFEVFLDRSRWETGEVLSGRICFPSRDPALAKVKAIELRVWADVTGSGEPETITLSALAMRGPFTAPSEHRFELPLPVDGPVSFEGMHVKVRWSAQVSLDLPWASDPRVVTRFTLCPAGAGARSSLRER